MYLSNIEKQQFVGLEKAVPTSARLMTAVPLKNCLQTHVAVFSSLFQFLLHFVFQDFGHIWMEIRVMGQQYFNHVGDEVLDNKTIKIKRNKTCENCDKMIYSILELSY